MTVRISRTPSQVVTGEGVQPPTRIEEPHQRFLGAVPEIDRALIDHLKSIFPASLSRQFGLREYDVMAGQHEVIQYLERLWKEQNE